MESQSKLRVTKDYSKLSDELKEQIKLVYPDGYSQHIFQYTNKEGKNTSALRFETDDRIYLIRMSLTEAQNLIEGDEDYDAQGNLRDEVRDNYELQIFKFGLSFG